MSFFFFSGLSVLPPLAAEGNAPPPPPAGNDDIPPPPAAEGNAPPPPPPAGNDDVPPPPAADDGEQQGMQRKGKKRIRNPETWIKNIRKKKRNSGQEYLNSKGNITQARKVGNDCKCRKKCFQMIDERTRQEIFDSFWAAADQEKQDAHLLALIEQIPVKRRRPRSNARGENYRQYTYKYHVRLPTGKLKDVCSKAFSAVFGINDSRVERVRSEAGVVPADRRGRHPCSRKISDEIKKQVENHILSFPRRSSHYSF